MYYIGATEEKNEKLKKEGKIKISIFIFIYTIHLAYLKVYTKFENTGSKICDGNFHWRERKKIHWRKKSRKIEQIKGLISNMWLFFL